ncbi:hypothetical protein PoB_003748200 [Plakobranchus ocellatus]|uniref:Uncharacterized protein n=1 Tax=Plakobranchus ocellatus TaxID=259542 RepID=A0AAV4AVF1_9GAST|nr:hypothetical protein PoB_003748200 [Plakobranchus ocellatus]
MNIWDPCKQTNYGLDPHNGGEVRKTTLDSYIDGREFENGNVTRVRPELRHLGTTGSSCWPLTTVTHDATRPSCEQEIDLSGAGGKTNQGRLLTPISSAGY